MPQAPRRAPRWVADPTTGERLAFVLVAVVLAFLGVVLLG
jgi:hypothetical protein